MIKKYLYGKKKFLSPIVEGTVSPRFSDISHYSRLENEKMRDDEMYKNFIIDRHSTIIKINDHIIQPSSLAEDSVISMPTQHCYCLCLTSRGNDPELFETFKADICLEIDVDALKETLEFVFSEKLKGAVVDAREVTYYDPRQPPLDIAPKNLVFFKPSMFSHEAEFRIAIFYPANKKGFLSESGITIPFSMPGESLHLSFSHPDPSLIKRCVVGTYEAYNA